MSKRLSQNDNVIFEGSNTNKGGINTKPISMKKSIKPPRWNKVSINGVKGYFVRVNLNTLEATTVSKAEAKNLE